MMSDTAELFPMTISADDGLLLLYSSDDNPVRRGNESTCKIILY